MVVTTTDIDGHRAVVLCVSFVACNIRREVKHQQHLATDMLIS